MKKPTKKQQQEWVDKANLLMSYNFRHVPYTYEGYPTPSWDSSMPLTENAEYVLVDRDCESHFVPFIAKFVRYESRGYNKEYLLFKEEGEIHDGAGDKGPIYYLVRPRAIVDLTTRASIKLELSTCYNLGNNPDSKIKIRAAEYI